MKSKTINKIDDHDYKTVIQTKYAWYCEDCGRWFPNSIKPQAHEDLVHTASGLVSQGVTKKIRSKIYSYILARYEPEEADANKTTDTIMQIIIFELQEQAEKIIEDWEIAVRCAEHEDADILSRIVIDTHIEMAKSKYLPKKVSEKSKEDKM